MHRSPMNLSQMENRVVDRATILILELHLQRGTKLEFVGDD